MLNYEFERFVNAWKNRAREYDDSELNGCYDKFFTLFVVFNRLYYEATSMLYNRDNSSVRLIGGKYFPDHDGATEHAFNVIGLNNFDNIYENKLKHDVNIIINLIRDHSFCIILSPRKAECQQEKDEKLVKKLESHGKTRAIAVLELIYQVRCNLFHGHKGFSPVQCDLLRPVNHILECVVDELYEQLKNA